MGAALDPPGVAQLHDGRAERRIVVVAPADHDPLLSAWTWSRGTGELTPLARYLLHAAVLRYELRVWTAARSGAALRHDAAAAGRAARAAISDGSDHGLLRARLKDLDGEEQRLIERRSRLRDLRDAAATAGRNMVLHVPDRSTGPFADDRELGDWFDRQLVTELARTDETLAELGAVLADGARAAGVPHGAGAVPRPAFVLGQDPRALERVLNRAAGFQHVYPFTAGLEREAARVCKVELVRRSGTATGTGFLIGPDLVLTNHHVVDSLVAGETSPTQLRCTFDHRLDADGALAASVPVGLAPDDWLVAASPHSPFDLMTDPPGPPEPDELDYAVLRLAGTPGLRTTADGAARGWLALDRAGAVPEVGAPLLILQHPDGEPVMWALDTDGVLGVNGNGTRLTYGVNTLSGSSGSPCFTFDLVPVAVHHSGAAEFDAGRNEGIPLAAIVADLRAGGVVLPGPPRSTGPSVPADRPTERGTL